MSIAVDDFRPALAGARPPPPRSKKERAAQARADVFPGIPPEAYREPFVDASFLTMRELMVSDPAAVKRVLVDNAANYPKGKIDNAVFRAMFGASLLALEGDLWRAHRRTMAPAFQPASVAAYVPAMVETSEAFLQRWSAPGAGATVDMADEMSLLTLQIISRTMFSTDSDDEVVALVNAAFKGDPLMPKFGYGDLLRFVLDPKMKTLTRSMDARFAALNAGIYRMIAARERGELSGGPDLLARLIAAKDEESGAKLTAQEVRDEVITIFFAGHDTTANAMGWTWYLLSQHPDAEARLHEELHAVLGGRAPAVDDIPKLAYTRRVLEEAMRLYPPAPAVSSRVALKEDELCGRRIHAGTTIDIITWIMHRHETLWEEPERFDPDRFLPERSLGRHRFAYLPFGAGQRVCIGQLMAMHEAILILGTLAQRVRPVLAHDAVVTLQRNLTLRPTGLRMRIERRG